MRGLRRHEDKHGLDDNRRTLIHRYMVEQADSPEPDKTPPPAPPQEPIEHLIDLPVLESETPGDPAPAPSLILVPPAPERREGGEVSVDVFRQTLGHVVRLSAQVAEAREEGSRRREQLTMRG